MTEEEELTKFREFRDLLNTQEVSDNDVEFYPNKWAISSCRCLDVLRLGELMRELGFKNQRRLRE